MLPKIARKLVSKEYVLRSAIGLSLMFLALLVLKAPLLAKGELARLALLVFTLVVFILCLVLIIEFGIKTIKLQSEKSSLNYSAVTSINGLLGLVLPLKYIAIILPLMMSILSQFPSSGSFFCQLRTELINQYRSQLVQMHLHQLIVWSVIILLGLFLFGGLIERSLKFNLSKSK